MGIAWIYSIASLWTWNINFCHLKELPKWHPRQIAVQGVLRIIINTCAVREMKNGRCDRVRLVLVLLWIIIKRINNKDHVTATTSMTNVSQWCLSDWTKMDNMWSASHLDSSQKARCPSDRDPFREQINCLSFVTSFLSECYYERILCGNAAQFNKSTIWSWVIFYVATDSVDGK